jgi:hypothetical protein
MMVSHLWQYLSEFFLEWEKFQINTHFMFNKFFPPENRAGYEIFSKNLLEPGKSQIT